MGFLQRLGLLPRRAKRVSPDPSVPPVEEPPAAPAPPPAPAPECAPSSARPRARTAEEAVAALAPHVARLRMAALGPDAFDDREGDEAGPSGLPASGRPSCSTSSSWASPRTSLSSVCSSASADSSPAASPPSRPTPECPALVALELPPSAAGSLTSSSAAYQRYLRKRLAAAPSVARVVGQIWSAIHAPRAGPEPDVLDFDRYTRSHLLIQRVLLPGPFDPLQAASKSKRDWAFDAESRPSVSRRRFTESIVQICAAQCAGGACAVPISASDLEGTSQRHFFRALDFLWRLLDAMTIFDSTIGCRRLRSCAEVSEHDVSAIAAFSSGGPLTPFSLALGTGPLEPPRAPKAGPATCKEAAAAAAAHAHGHGHVEGERDLSAASVLQRRAAANRTRRPGAASPAFHYPL